MFLIFSECKKNSNEAAVFYIQRYPDRNHPSEKIFRNIEQCLEKIAINFLMENVLIKVLFRIIITLQ